MAGLLLDTDLSDDQRRQAETLRSSGNDLLRLVNDILDYSKIEAGHLDMEMLDFDLRSLMDEVGSMLAPRAEASGIELILVVEPGAPTFMRGDPGRLRQILNNLIGNALKFTSQGEVVVRARLEGEREGESRWRFTVRDTGIGIPAGGQSDLFEQFTQVDASTTRRYGGTGLGLAISKQLASAMGGEIGFESEEGRGTEFWFTACFQRGLGPILEIPAQTVIAGSRILVVDDNATNLEILTTLLRSHEVRASAASGAEVALEMLREATEGDDPYQVALIDMRMPGVSGDALGRSIMADAALAETHMVLLTSGGMSGEAAIVEEIGFCGYLVKPVRESDLIDCLAAVLGDGVRQCGAVVTRQAILERRARHVRRERTGSVRVLVAEDNVTNQQVAIGVLESLGASVEVVANGREAVEAIRTIPYDVIFMDVQMPEMDGLAATEAIRASNMERRDVPIVAMTANAMKGDRERCLDAGMDDYLSKPIDRERVGAALERWGARDAG